MVQARLFNGAYDPPLHRYLVSSSPVMLQVIVQKLRLSGDFDFAAVAAQTPGFVGADLQALTKEAAAVAVSRIFASLDPGPGPFASSSLAQVRSTAHPAHKLLDLKFWHLANTATSSTKYETMTGT